MYTIFLSPMRVGAHFSLGLAREAKRRVTRFAQQDVGKSSSSGAMQEEIERAARVLFFFCSFLLGANEFLISFQTHAQVLGRVGP